MPAYRWPIPAADRWAIVAYVRDLEHKRLASAPAAPPETKSPTDTKSPAESKSPTEPK